MKAKYILNAIAAMRDADRLNYTMEPKEFGTIQARLAEARINLECYSGLREVDVPIEREEEARHGDRAYGPDRE